VAPNLHFPIFEAIKTIPGKLRAKAVALKVYWIKGSPAAPEELGK
jgi:hypothetical protein